MRIHTAEFTQRLTAIRDGKLAIARTVAADYVGRDDVEAVFLTGSLLAGLGSSYSDVDLFVIMKDDKDRRPRQLKLDGQRVDVEFRPHGWMQSMADEIRFDASTADPWSIVRSKVPYDLTVRLLLSEPIKTSPEYDDVVRQLRQSETDLRRLIVGRYAQMAFGNLEDCLGFLEDGDVTSALVVSHDLLLNALQSFTAGCGDLYLGQKWILRKLDRSAGSAFPHDTLRDLLHRVEDPAATVESRLRFAQSAVSAALLSGWDAPEASSWTEWQQGTSSVVRSIEWLPLRLTDAVVLAHRAQKTLKITPRALALWARIDGHRSADEVAEAVACELSGEETAALMEVLVAKLAIHPPTAPAVPASTPQSVADAVPSR